MNIDYTKNPFSLFESKEKILLAKSFQIAIEEYRKIGKETEQYSDAILALQLFKYLLESMDKESLTKCDKYIKKVLDENNL